MSWRSTRSIVSAGLRVCCLSIGLAALVQAPLFADEQDCTRSTMRYNAALNGVQSAAGQFSSCAGSSAGRYDCSHELDRLKSAGDDYKDAVSDYRSDCQ